MAPDNKTGDKPAAPTQGDLFTARPAVAPKRAAAPEVPAMQQGIAAKRREPALEEPHTYKVAELVHLASRKLEAHFPSVWVEGELSNCRPYNGSCYFTLKDADAQLPSVIWSAAYGRLKFRLADGQKVRCRGRLTIWERSGRFQLAVDLVEPVGLGALQLAKEQLAAKLKAEGLFDPARKRALPFLPRRIGVATSRDGAAVRDIIRVATRRAPVRLLIAHCQVQGEGAPPDIVRAIAALARQPDVDLIIVGRGGGSIEDLWAFNDERVARAIAACRVPVISAVGHEVDVTIADFVADVRAATPSQAAELAVREHARLDRELSELRTRLAPAARRRIEEARQRLDAEVADAAVLLRRSIDARRAKGRALDRRLDQLHPRARLAAQRRSLADLDGRLRAPPRAHVERAHRELPQLDRRLHVAMQRELAEAHKVLPDLERRLHAAMQQGVDRRRRTLAQAGGKLDAMSPLRVLERGYGLVLGPGGHVEARATDVRPGDPIEVRLGRGQLGARVERVDDESDE